MHVFLFVLDAGQCARQLTYHVLELCVAHFLLARCARCALRCIAQFDGEHDQFRCHAAALVVKAYGINTLRGRNERVFARRLLLALMHNMIIGSGYFDVHIQKAALNHLECDTCKCACACVCVSV